MENNGEKPGKLTPEEVIKRLQRLQYDVDMAIWKLVDEFKKEVNDSVLFNPRDEYEGIENDPIFKLVPIFLSGRIWTSEEIGWLTQRWAEIEKLKQCRQIEKS